MNKVYLDENIFYIDNFINAEDIDFILKIFYANDPQFVNKEVYGIHQICDFYHPECEKIWNQTSKKIKELFNNDKERATNLSSNVRLIDYYLDDSNDNKNEEWAMLPHSDTFDIKSESGDVLGQVLVNKGFILFFTDNFDGGEIVYVNKNISFKPKSGTLLCHPGSDEYTHGVNKFSGGDRIIVSGFVHQVPCSCHECRMSLEDEYVNRQSIPDNYKIQKPN